MKKIFITGASSGIGESLARYYAANGAQLGLVARRADWLEGVANSITPRPEIYVCDVRDAQALKRAAAAFIERHGVPVVELRSVQPLKTGPRRMTQADLDWLETNRIRPKAGAVDSVTLVRQMRDEGY